MNDSCKSGLSYRSKKITPVIMDSLRQITLEIAALSQTPQSCVCCINKRMSCGPHRYVGHALIVVCTRPVHRDEIVKLRSVLLLVTGRGHCLLLIEADCSAANALLPQGESPSDTAMYHCIR